MERIDNFFYDNLEVTNKCGFILVLNNEPIGHISWDPRHVSEYVIIGHNCITSKYKGQGYGKVLLTEAIKRIKEYDGLKKIVVTTNETLIPAQHNYESVSFKINKKRTNLESPFSGDYVDYEMKL